MVMSFFGAGNRSNEFRGIINEFSLGHGEFELPVELSDCNTGLVPEEMWLEMQREVGRAPQGASGEADWGLLLGLI